MSAGMCQAQRRVEICQLLVLIHVPPLVHIDDVDPPTLCIQPPGGHTVGPNPLLVEAVGVLVSLE